MAIFNSYVSLPEGICGDDCCFITILRDQKWPGPRISQEVWPHAQPEGRATGLVLGSALHFAEGNIAHTCIYTIYIYIYIHTYRHVYIHVHVWYIYICTVHSIRYVDLLSVYVFIYIYMSIHSLTPQRELETGIIFGHLHSYVVAISLDGGLNHQTWCTAGYPSKRDDHPTADLTNSS